MRAPPTFEQVLKFLIMGNVRRGQLYPLCVGAERVLQAQTIAQMARSSAAHGRARLHGGRQRPGALRSRAAHAGAGPRDPRAGARPRLQAPRAARVPAGAPLPVPPFGAAYSVNRGLWGVTIGGKETLTSAAAFPRAPGCCRRMPSAQPRAPSATRSASSGRSGGLDGARCPGRDHRALEALAGPFGIGRGIHLGDTIIGTKGRVAFEAPAAEVLLTRIASSRNWC
jgi:argininosuccinate synthase